MKPDRPVDRTLAQRQAELVAALVAGGPAPYGFDQARVVATADALLFKRAGEVGARWPALCAQFGPEWTVEFARWARNRPPHGSLRDGWDFARHLAASSVLGDVAATELATAEATHRYDGSGPPRARRLPTVRIGGRGLALQFGGRVWTFGP
jgi:hypothetical protein